MFNSVIKTTGLDINSAVICIVTAIILGLIIATLHMKSSKYTKNYIVTLALLPLLVATVMIMVNGNLGTGVAIAGAFSLVRFRSMPGNSREIVSVFFAMAIGIAVGMGQVFFATIVTLVVSILFLIFYSTKFGESNASSKTLDIVIPESLDYEEVFDSLLKKYTTKYELVKIKTTNLGSLYELKYDISLKKGIKLKDLIDEIRVRNGNLKVSIHRNEREEML